MINYEPTADAIREVAAKARQLADDLHHIADKCILQQDLSYADEAISAIQSAYFNMCISRLASRPIRELDKEIVRLKEQAA